MATPVADQWRPYAQSILQQGTGSPEVTFQDDQWEVIVRLVWDAERLLVVQRTGWGKSAVYFIGTRLQRAFGRGPTIIVSPLLALMRNQVEAGRRYGLRIETLNSESAGRFDQILSMVRRDEIDVLLISPERLANSRFAENYLPVLMKRVGMLVIDEAHCISDWGHDFRPDYQRLIHLIRQLPGGVPVVATTATATDRVVSNISSQLGRLKVVRGDLSRSNLALQTMPDMGTGERRAWVAQTISGLPGSGIVYVLTRMEAERLARWLAYRGILAHAYHSTIVTDRNKDSVKAKMELEERFTAGSLRVLVATSSLGMGYDHPGVQFVIHYQTPPSIVAYYQQVGRAGRGSAPAIGILMGGKKDARTHERFRASSLPSEGNIWRILDVLERYGPLTFEELVNGAGLSREDVLQTVKYLEAQHSAPVIREMGKYRIHRTAGIEDYQTKAKHLAASKEREWAEIERYRLSRQGCLQQQLLEALSSPNAFDRCGMCAHCLGRPLVPVGVDDAVLADWTQYSSRKVRSRPEDPEKSSHPAPNMELPAPTLGTAYIHRLGPRVGHVFGFQPAQPSRIEKHGSASSHSVQHVEELGDARSAPHTTGIAPGRPSTAAVEPSIIPLAKVTQPVRSAWNLPVHSVDIFQRRRFARRSAGSYGLSRAIAPHHLVGRGRTLGYAGDNAWGDRALQAIRQKHISNEFVHAAAHFIAEAWAPVPSPLWITSVPSRRHPGLIEEFAQAIAQDLEIPFRQVIERVKDTAPLEADLESADRCRSLGGAFRLSGMMNLGSVLLIDDMFHSGRTLTLIGVLMRQAGSGPVQPFALVSVRGQQPSDVLS